MVKPGLLIRMRKEWRTSASSVSIIAYTERRANWFPQKESLILKLYRLDFVFEAREVIHLDD